MNEIIETYMEDQKEKSITKRKPIVSKPAREKFEMKHGVCHSVNKNMPISYGEFKRLSVTLQHEYLQHIVDEYHVGVGSIANMLGCSRYTLHRLFNDLNIQNRPAKTMGADEARFLNQFVNLHKISSYELPVEEIIPPIDITPEVQKESQGSVFDALKMLIDSGIEMEIKIKIGGKNDG